MIKELNSMFKIDTLIIISILLITISGCDSAISKDDLLHLMKNENFDEINEVVDDYIEENPNDELGYISKAFVMINNREEISSILPIINKAYDTSRKDNYNLQLGLSIHLSRNGFCDEALAVFRPKSFLLTNSNEPNYPIIAEGFLYCKSSFSNPSIDYMKKTYETIFVNSLYDIEISQMYLSFLIENDYKNDAEKMVIIYEQNKPRSDSLRKQLSEASINLNN